MYPTLEPYPPAHIVSVLILQGRIARPTGARPTGARPKKFFVLELAKLDKFQPIRRKKLLCWSSGPFPILLQTAEF